MCGVHVARAGVLAQRARQDGDKLVCVLYVHGRGVIFVKTEPAHENAPVKNW